MKLSLILGNVELQVATSTKDANSSKFIASNLSFGLTMAGEANQLNRYTRRLVAD
jgi:hypothetical protein